MGHRRRFCTHPHNTATQLTAKMWFCCPVRPDEMTAAVQYNNNLPINTLNDLTNYMYSSSGEGGGCMS